MRLIYNGDRRNNGNGIAATMLTDHENRVTHNTNIQVLEDNMGKIIVRRLTPLECERLQGYPDGWTLIGQPEEVWVKNKVTVIDDAESLGDGEVSDNFLKSMEAHEEERPGYHKEVKYYYIDDSGKKREVTDSARYKALGNSIALPQWFYIAQKLKMILPKNATVGSLFDGIGGFPLVWEATYGKGTARWASEIEAFPIAVTKERFGEEENEGIKSHRD